MDKEKKIFVDIFETMDSKTFSTYIVPSLENEMGDPNARFIFKIRPIYILKYMQSRKYTKCDVYISPEENLPIKTKGYNIIKVSAAEIDITIKHNSDKIIYFNKDSLEVEIITPR